MAYARLVDGMHNTHKHTQNTQPLRELSAHREALRAISVGPTDLKFATASDDSTIKVWDMYSCEVETTLTGESVCSCVCSCVLCVCVTASDTARSKFGTCTAAKWRAYLSAC